MGVSLALSSPVDSSKLKACVGLRKSSAEAISWSGFGSVSGVDSGVFGVGVNIGSGGVCVIDVRLVVDFLGLDLVEDFLLTGFVTVFEVDDARVVFLIATVFRGDDFGVVGFAVLVREEAAFLERRETSPSIDLFGSIVYNYIMKVQKITKKQQAVLNFLEDFTEENGYSPSYREIQSGLGLSSVSEHIDNMVSKGILKKVPGAARSLEVLDFRHTETVELFKARMAEVSEEERKILVAAAEVLGLDLE